MIYDVTLVPARPGPDATDLCIRVSAATGDEAAHLAGKPGYVVRGVHPAPRKVVRASRRRLEQGGAP